jgi:hypothetical protein
MKMGLTRVESVVISTRAATLSVPKERAREGERERLLYRNTPLRELFRAHCTNSTAYGNNVQLGKC